MAWLENLTSVFKGKAAREIHLGAFGKHPGWDDHLEDFGLETEALLGARQLLYVRGIGGAIDGALWDNLPPENVLPEFNHSLFWVSSAETLIGRIWSSSDRKGRKRYPMIVCAHLSWIADGATIERVLRELREVEEQCKAATSASTVQQILSTARDRIRSQNSETGESNVPPLVSRTSLADRLKLNTGDETWARICYAVETQLTAFAGAKLSDRLRRIDTRMPEANVVAQHLRLPSDPGQTVPVEQFWEAFIHQQLASKAPLLLLQSQDDRWMDVVIGTPGPQQMFCLRAGIGALPPIADIPYTLPPGFMDRSAQLLSAFCQAA